MSDEEFEALRLFVKEKAGWELEAGSKSLMELRLSRYKNNPEGFPRSIGALLDAMTVQETYFFREPCAFGALEEILKLHQKHQPVRILSAACATGQEPYSIVMKGFEVGVSVEVSAVDISPSALARANAGVYQAHEVGRGMTEEALHKYFMLEGTAWRVRPMVKERVGFFQHNLLEPLSHRRGQFTAIFIRNALIYFTKEARRKALLNLLACLPEGGYLVLSATENALGFEEWVRPVTMGGMTVYQRTKLQIGV